MEQQGVHPMRWLLPLLLLSLELTGSNAGGICPPSFSKEVCRNGVRLRINAIYELATDGKCERRLSSHVLPDPECPPPRRVEVTPCVNGQTTEVTEAYQLVDCKCTKILRTQQKPCQRCMRCLLACPVEFHNLLSHSESCKPCEVIRRECNSTTQSLAIVTKCYLHTEEGICRPILKVNYEPCGNCETKLIKKSGPCDFCKGQRAIQLFTTFREEGGQRRCLVAKKVIQEPCACKQGVWSKKICINKDTIVQKLIHRSQISCSICQAKKFQIFDRKIRCRGRVVVRQPCRLDEATGYWYQTVQVINEYPENCECKRSTYSIRQVCGCPREVKRETSCYAQTHTLFTRVTSYRLDKDEASGRAFCQPVVHIERSPSPPCPPPNTTIDEPQYSCDHRSCERSASTMEWRQDGCQCKQVNVRRPVGFCCCPKPKSEVSECIDRSRTVRHIFFELFNGQCQRHVTISEEACGELSSKDNFNCDETTGMKVFTTARWQFLPSGGSVETIQIRRIPTLCQGVEVVSVSKCREEPGSTRQFRNILIITRAREGCECGPPVSRVIKEACRCEDVDSGELVEAGTQLKVQTGCRPECKPGADVCGSIQCKNIQQWFKMEFINEDEDLQNSTRPPRCRRSLFRREVSDCCCPTTPVIKKVCDASGKRWLMKRTESYFDGGLCSQSVVTWSEPVNCSNGFVGREIGKRRPDGMQEVRLIFEAIEECRCERYLQRIDCPWRCPPPESRTYCDPYLNETVFEVVKHALIGCKCQRQVQRVISRAACPNYSIVVSRKCSKETGLETVITKSIVQEGCECKVVMRKKEARCSCPPTERGPMLCNPVTNRMEQKVKQWILIGGRCQPIEDVIEKPTVCSDEANIENSTVATSLVCNEKTGWGQLTRPIWSVENCKCIRNVKVIREGPCRCPPPKRSTQCDASKGRLIIRTAVFELDKATLRCSAHIQTTGRTISCPHPEEVVSPCNTTLRQQKVTRVTYRAEDCSCKRTEHTSILPCGCPAAAKIISSAPRCDPERSERIIETRRPEWRDNLRACVEVKQTLRIPVVCSPHVSYQLGKCINGTQLLKTRILTADVNSCRCRGSVKIRRISCACPPRRLIIGRCASGASTALAVIFIRNWDERLGRCIVVDRYQKRLFCTCPVTREEVSCKAGAVEIKKVSYELYADQYGCRRKEEVYRVRPQCRAQTKEQRGECNRETCKQTSAVYARTYDPKTCQCIWALQGRRECSCCGCPKRSIKFQCFNNTVIYATVDYFIPKQSECNLECQRMRKVFKKHAACKEKKVLEKPTWSECDTSTCTQQLSGAVPVLEKCQCKYVKKVFAQRKCCCPSVKQEIEICRDGKRIREIRTLVLDNFECKQKVTYIPKDQDCHRAPEVKAGDCDPQTCKRNIYEISWIRGRSDCRCQPVQRLVKEEDCCCLPNPRPKSLCVGTCKVEIHTHSKFYNDQRRCIKYQQLYRKCPTCPEKYEEPGQCDRTNTCLRPVKEISYTIENCECVKQVTSRMKRCCCAAPPQEPPRCLEDEHVLVYKTVKMDFLHGQCVPKTREEFVPVVCPPKDSFDSDQSSTQVGACDPNTCHRKVVEVNWHLSACKCVPNRHERLEPCCCMHIPKRVKQICHKDGSMTKVIRYSKLVGDKCLPEILTEQQPRSACPPVRIQPIGPCNQHTGRQPIEINRYELDHCHCRIVSTQRKDRICSCPDGEKTSSACNPSTCQQEVTETRYLAVNGSCVLLPPIKSLQACCCRQGEVPYSVRRECDADSGLLIEIHTFGQFDKNLRQCLPALQRRVIQPPECEKQRSVKRGVCNKLTGFATDVLFRNQFNKASCSCEMVKKLVPRRCDCSHLPLPEKQVQCDRALNVLTKVSVTYKLKDGECIKTNDVSRQQIACPMPVSNELDCDPRTCMATVQTTNYIPEHCKCVPRLSTKKVLCCCPPDARSTHCLENGTLTVQRLIKFRLDRENQRCEKSVHIEKREIACDTDRVVELQRSCHEASCHPVSLVLLNRRQHCKCVQKRLEIVHKKKYCCCPPAKTVLQCVRETGVLQKTTHKYELVDEKCVARKDILQEKVSCPEEKMIHGSCDPLTKRRLVTRIYYVIEDCKCVQKVDRTTEICACPPVQVVRQPCLPGLPTRNVTEITYKRLNAESSGKPAVCAKRIRLLHSEPCYCPERYTAKRCVGGGRLELRTTTFRLAERDGGRLTCIREDEVSRIPVTCPVSAAAKVIATDCQQNRRNVTTFHPVLDPATCSCLVRQETRTEACDCENKNFMRVACAGNALVVSIGEFSSRPGDRHCTIKASQKTEPIVYSPVPPYYPTDCPRNEEIVNPGTGCSVEMKGGLYRAEIRRWQEVENCRCVPRQKILHSLCSCQKPQTVEVCEDHSKLIVERLVFHRIGDRCMPNHQIVNREIRCDQATRIVGTSACVKTRPSLSSNSTELCEETITVEEQAVQNCKCVKRLRTFKRRCCAPPPVVRRICDRSTGQWLTTTHKYKLTESKLLYSAENLEIWDRDINTVSDTTAEQVICPEREISEQCNKDTGVWTKVVIEHQRDGCICKAKKVLHTGRCSCPEQKVWASPCSQEFRTVRVVFYKLLNQTCVRFTKALRQRCACPQPIRRLYCDGEGRWVKCLTEFLFNNEAKTCRISKQCVRWTPVCPPRRRITLASCAESTNFMQTLQTVEFSLDKPTCRCRVRKQAPWREFCRCDHLNNQSVSCSGGIRTTKQIVHTLIEGKCVARVITNAERILCPEAQTVVGACDRDPASPHRGMRIKTVTSFVPEGCKCTQKVEKLLEVCDCQAKFGNSVVTNCLRDEEIEQATKTWFLVDGKCKPKVILTRRIVDCSGQTHLRRVVQSACLVGADGVGRRNITVFGPRPKGCQCVSAPVSSISEICSCPQNITTTQCMPGGKTLLRTHTAFSLVRRNGGVECLREVTQARLDPCVGQSRGEVEKPSACNLTTCHKLIEITTHVPEDCKCIIKRTQKRETCCCPPPTQPKYTCNQAENILVKEVRVNQLLSALPIGDRMRQVEPFCDTQLITTKVKVSCADHKPKIMMSTCKDNFRAVKVLVQVPINCKCIEKVAQVLRMRCGCPRTIRRIKGRCQDAWALDKWVGLQAVNYTQTTKTGQKLQATHCRPVVLRKARRRCACPAFQMLRQCLPGNLLKITRTDFFLNASSNDCARRTSEQTHPTVCPRPHIRVSECGATGKEFFATETITNWTAVDCVCMPKVHQRDFICDCAAKFPPQTKYECKLDSFKEVVVTRWTLQGRTCVPGITKSSSRITCEDQPKPSRGPCNLATGRRTIHWLKKVPINCECQWKPLSVDEVKRLGLKLSEACVCPEPRIERVCSPGGNLKRLAAGGILAYQVLELRTTRFRLVDGECRGLTESTVRNVTCATGTQYVRTKCDALTRTNQEIRTTGSLEGCQCRRVSARRTCQCACPAPKETTECNDRTGVLRVIRETYQLDAGKCSCVASTHVSENFIDCPEGIVFKRSVGSCQPKPDAKGDEVGDRFRLVTWNTVSRDGCKCVQKTHRVLEACDCARRPVITKRCLQQMVQEIVHTERVLTNDKKCATKVVSRILQPVRCPEAKKLIYCNETTGIATVTKLQPMVENCECKSTVQTYQMRCKCNPQTTFVRQTACSKDCKTTVIQQREKLTADGVCKPELIAQVKKCCCPRPAVIRRNCDSASGMNSITTRVFKLVQGECIPVDKTVSRATTCSSNETVRVLKEPSGWLRLERTKEIRIGCRCHMRSQISRKKWKCPEISRKTLCVELSDQQQAWKTVLVMWKSSTKESVCSRREIFTKLQPIVCSIPPQNISDCFFDAKRHAFVRRILNFKTRLEGCHCVREPPTVTFQVCSCAKPVQRVKCAKKDGMVHVSRVRFEVSADGSRCVAHETRKTWRKVCYPAMPLLRSQTTCADSQDGQRYKVYVHRVREGCKCVERETRVALPCACPAAVERADCLGENTQVKTSITYVRHPDGSCERQQKVFRLPIECKLPANLLISGREYTVRLSANGTVVEHVFACGASCLRRVRTASLSGPRNCKCAVLWQESTEACCCRDVQTKSLAAVGSEAVAAEFTQTWRDCSGSNAMLYRHQKRWHLVNGICRASTFTHGEPLICDSGEVLRPIGMCLRGQQRFLLTKTQLQGCDCKRQQSVVWRPCLCITLSKAEIVFLVDESVSSRIDGYSLRVRELLKHIIRTFKSDRLDGNGTDYRFAVVKYASNPSIAFNLDDYAVSPPMLHHVDNLHYEGRLSNLGRALDLTNREVLSKSRKDIVKMIYLISDGVNDISAAPDIAATLRASGVQINVLVFGSDKRGHIFLSKLASEPKQRHFVVIRATQQTKELSDWLIQTLCLRACPPTKVTRGACSRKTNCVGYIYSHVYQYSPAHGHCLGTTHRRAYECCCTQEPRSKTSCVSGRLINTKEVWRLRVNKFGIPACHQFKLEEDVTPILEKDCSRAATVVQGTCLPDGTRMDKIITKRLVDCQCKELVKTIQRRCFCPAKKTKTQCYSDKVQETTRILSKLVDGQCEETVEITRNTVVCSEPKVFATKCDSLTCQRRIVFVEERAHQCKCLRSLKATRETCCCPARDPIKRSSCAHDDTKVFAVSKISFVDSLRTCLTTEEFTYEAVGCPTEPIITRSACRATQPSDAITTGAAHLDPNLLYRRVTIEQAYLTNCQCTRRQHSVFEVCGCREPEQRLVRRCHPEQGILVTYKQNYQLTVVADNQTYVGGRALGRRVSSLLQAHCRPIFSAQVVTRTFCPESNILTGPCIRSGGDEGRAYRRVEYEDWQREGCECKKAAPRVLQKLCGCRKNVWYRKECRKTAAQPGGVLIIHRIRERLVTPPGKDVPVCRVEVQKATKKLECPPPKARYTNCVNGTLWVTVELVTLRNCKCETKQFRRPLKCMQFNRAGERTDGGAPLLPMRRHPYDGNNTDQLPSRLMEGQWQRSMEVLKEKLQELGLFKVKSWAGDMQQLQAAGRPMLPKTSNFAPPSGLLGAMPRMPAGAKPLPQGQQQHPIPNQLQQMLFKGLKLAVPLPPALGKGQVPKPGWARGPGLLLFNDLPKGLLPQQPRPLNGTAKLLTGQSIRRGPPSISAPIEGLPYMPESLRFVQCADVLPSEKCLQLERRPHLSCDKPGQVRDHLCRQTCRICQDYPLNRTDFELVHADADTNACLLTDLRLDRRYFLRVLEEVGFAECRRTCTAEPQCLSFDFYVPSAATITEGAFNQQRIVPGTCVLNRVDLQTLRRRTLPELVPIGATPEALKARRAARCLLFRRVRLEDCEPAKLQYSSDCECEQIKSNYPFAEEVLTGTEPKSGRLHCMRKATLITYVHGHNGKCEQRTHPLSVVCQPVRRDQLLQQLNTHRLTTTNQSRNSYVDQRPTNWCEEAARVGGCKDAFTRKVCGGTCGVGICKRAYTYYGKCQSTGRMTVLRVHYKLDLDHGRCVVIKEAQTFLCDRCPVGSFEIVTPCDKASKKRQLIRITAAVNVAKISGKSPSCRFKMRKQELNCQGCTFADGESAEKQSISACQLTASKKFRLAVRKEYMVNNNGCCEIRRSYRLFPCKGCPKAHSTTSKCVDNFRLRRVVFYTRPSIGKFSNDRLPIPPSLCIRHVIVEKESCVQQLAETRDCRDLIGSAGCEEFKHLNHCTTRPHAARLLCPKACGLC